MTITMQIMRFTVVLIIATLIQVNTSVFGQTITLNRKNISIKQMFKEIQKQTGLNVFLSSRNLNMAKKIDISFNAAPVAEVVKACISGLPLSFSIEANTIVIREKENLNGDNVNASRVKDSLIHFSGVIVDENENPLSGATLKIKRTGQTTLSAVDGTFGIYTRRDSFLQITFVGYADQELNLNHTDDKKPLIIKMKPYSSNLDQVQILAYGTTTKRLNTGSSYSISSNEIAQNPVGNVLQAIKHRIPGVEIVENTGQAGGSFTVRIRGINSLGTNVDPLYIVDGVAYPAGGQNGGQSPGALPLINNFAGISVGSRGGNALNFLNPDDIERVDVLKDADATSLYGSRGAHGVILITTKTAIGGKPQLSLNINKGLSATSSRPELLGTADYLTLRREGLKNDQMPVSQRDLDINGTFPENRYTDFQEQLMGNFAALTRINLKYSGGSELNSYLIGGSYNDQANIEKGGGSKRDAGVKFMVSNSEKSQKFSIMLAGSFYSTTDDIAPFDFWNSNAVFQAPNAPDLFLADGRLNWAPDNAAALMLITHEGVNNNLLANNTITYKPVKGLTIRSQLGYNQLSGKEILTRPSTSFSPEITNSSQNSSGASNNYSIRTWTIDPNLTYVTDLAKGELSLTTGLTVQDKLVHYQSITGTNFVSDALLTNPNNGFVVDVRFSDNRARYLGYFLKANYNWAGKYIFNANLRIDGSSKFGPDHRYGSFGSIGAAYIFSEENWIKENIHFLSFGKLKASYGTVGSDGILSNLYYASYALNPSYQGKSSLTPRGLSNNDLHWEFNRSRNIGLSLGFLKDRLFLDMEYYKTSTTDQLVFQPLSSVTGNSGVTLNSDEAILENKGWEFSLVSRNLETKNLRWTTNLNLTVPRTKLAAFPNSYILPGLNYVVGQPVTNLRLFNYAGVSPETGYYNFINSKGEKGRFIQFVDPTTLDFFADKTENLDISSRFRGSITNLINFKALSLEFTFSINNVVSRNHLGRQFSLTGNYNQNTYPISLKRWQKPGDLTAIPKATSNNLIAIFSQYLFTQSTGAFERITYSRLQNLSLSYSLPESFLKKMRLSLIKIKLEGQNLLTISKYNDLDPETIETDGLPPLRTINFGVNLTF